MSADNGVMQARVIVLRTLAGGIPKPIVKTFFDEVTFTATHVVHDPLSKAAAVIDSVMDFDEAAGRTSFLGADRIVDYVNPQDLKVAWHLETHVHADHLSAAQYLREKLGGAIAIGENVRTVQEVFGTIFNEGADFARDGSDFDRLFTDAERFDVGTIPAVALYVPGHTPADVAYIVGDAAFIGDTMFMPDYGTARCDFPGGDARKLYGSIRRLMELPDETRLFLCHDYKALPSRTEFVWETTIKAQRTGNVHVREGITEDEFVAMRTARDANLNMPRLILPAVQVNMKAGCLPPAQSNGSRYLKLPLNLL